MNITYSLPQIVESLFGKLDEKVIHTAIGNRIFHIKMTYMYTVVLCSNDGHLRHSIFPTLCGSTVPNGGNYTVSI